MYLRVLVFLACAAVVCSGCAGGPEVSPAAFPESYGPLEHDAELMAKIEELFEGKAPLGRAGAFTIPQLRVIARGTRSAPVAVLKCDVAVFKAFIASDWVPIVVLGPPAGRKRLLAVVGYDDSTEEFILSDSEDNSQRRMKYPRFFRMLAGPQKGCLLMFSQYTGTASIRRALKNYIPEERADKIHIRTPRDR